MAVDLADFVPSLRREVTPPGSDLFTDVSDDVFTGYLADAFWEARLDGFLAKWTADEDGIVTPAASGTPELTRDLVALIILYAGIKVLRNKILNTNTTFRATAGPVEFETQNSATMLVELLKQLKASKDRILDLVADSGFTPVELIDAYAVRQFSNTSYYGLEGTIFGELDQLAISSGLR